MAREPGQKPNAPRSWRRASALYLRAWDQPRPKNRRERKAIGRMRKAEVAMFGVATSKTTT